MVVRATAETLGGATLVVAKSSAIWSGIDLCVDGYVSKISLFDVL